MASSSREKTRVASKARAPWDHSAARVAYANGVVQTENSEKDGITGVLVEPFQGTRGVCRVQPGVALALLSDPRLLSITPVGVEKAWQPLIETEFWELLRIVCATLLVFHET